jgi:hypothetical protein
MRCEPRAREYTDGGGAPQRCCGVEATNTKPFPEFQACAKEANPARYDCSAKTEKRVHEADRSHPQFLLFRRDLVPNARENAHRCSADEICIA